MYIRRFIPMISKELVVNVGFPSQMKQIMNGRATSTTAVVRSSACQSNAEDVAPRMHALSMDNTTQGKDQPTSYTATKDHAKRRLSISYEEMKRLMDTYGPLKAKRNHSSRAVGIATKPELVRRKFYRWFPDFNERFIKVYEGMLVPKAGHLQEMEYRGAMRQMDQNSLVKKRNDKRYSCGLI